MVHIPCGHFVRGSSLSEDEMPMYTIYMDSFDIDKYPVSNHEFNKFILNDGYKKKNFWCELGWEFINKLKITSPAYWNNKNWNGPNQPVTGISWYEARAFAHYSGKELPTEAQWEYAAKGVDNNRMYPWGNDEPDLKRYANYAPECEPSELERASINNGTHSKNISYYGCIDMAGNLAEWCFDNYLPNYSWDTIKSNSVYIDYESDTFLTKGGSGLHDEFYMRCSSRDPYKGTVRDNIVGFRCVRNPL